MCLTDDRRIIAVGNDHAGAGRQERLPVQRRGVETGGDRPVEAVAAAEIIGPFAVTEQIGARHLDLDDDDVAA